MVDKSARFTHDIDVFLSSPFLTVFSSEYLVTSPSTVDRINGTQSTFIE
jgi:hypothetical protein